MANTYPLAPRWRRFVCLFYDALLLTAVLMCAVVPMGVLMWGYAKLSGVLPAGPIWSTTVLLYTVLVTYGYVAICWRYAGQTLAMKTWRLRLVASDERAMTWRTMFVRYAVIALTSAPLLPALLVVKHIPGHWVWLALLWALLPYLWSWLDKSGQFLQDRLAGTHIELMPIRREQ